MSRDKIDQLRESAYKLSYWLQSLPDCTDIAPFIISIGTKQFAACQYKQGTNENRIYIICDSNPPKYWHKYHVVYNLLKKDYYLASYYPGSMFLNSQRSKYWDSNPYNVDIAKYHPFGNNMLLIENIVLDLSDRKIMPCKSIDL